MTPFVSLRLAAAVDLVERLVHGRERRQESKSSSKEMLLQGKGSEHAIRLRHFSVLEAGLPL